jgi:hypothetical protein
MSTNKNPILRVIELTPQHGQATKPSELIQITGHQDLSLVARRSITLLWHNAHMQGIEDNKDYTIEISNLLPTNHKGYEQVTEAVLALMKCVVVVREPDGSTTQVQILGGNNLQSPTRPAGLFTYSFDRRLVNILQNSEIWGKISLPILISLSSKYSVSLYENVAQWVGLTYKTSTRVTLEEFRDMLGVESSKYHTFGVLNTHVIKPSVAEINAMAPFSIGILPIKTGRKVTHIHINWWRKNIDELKQAWRELQQPKFGRKARISGQTVTVLEPYTDINKLHTR